MLRSVDGLLGIAHYAQKAGFQRQRPLGTRVGRNLARSSLPLFGQQGDDLELNPIRVLKFVDQQRSHPSVDLGARRQRISQQVASADQKLGEIQAPAFRQVRSISLLELCKERSKAVLERRHHTAAIEVQQRQMAGPISHHPALQRLQQLPRAIALPSKVRLGFNRIPQGGKAIRLQEVAQVQSIDRPLALGEDWAESSTARAIGGPCVFHQLSDLQNRALKLLDGHQAKMINQTSWELPSGKAQLAAESHGCRLFALEPVEDQALRGVSDQLLGVPLFQDSEPGVHTPIHWRLAEDLRTEGVKRPDRGRAQLIRDLPPEKRAERSSLADEGGRQSRLSLRLIPRKRLDAVTKPFTHLCRRLLGKGHHQQLRWAQRVTARARSRQELQANRHQAVRFAASCSGDQRQIAVKR